MKKASVNLDSRAAPKPAVFYIPDAAVFLGTTEKALRRQVERRRVPFRRLGKKVIFLRSELAAWLEGLPGVTLAEVTEMRERRG